MVLVVRLSDEIRSDQGFEEVREVRSYGPVLSVFGGNAQAGQSFQSHVPVDFPRDLPGITQQLRDAARVVTRNLQIDAESHAGFASGDCYGMEADHFAAMLLMPDSLFTNAMRAAGAGLAAIERLAEKCRTSLTATAIRYAKCSRDPVAIVLSTGRQINYCFMSNAFKEVKGLEWIRKGERLARNTATFAFNRNPERVLQVDRVEAAGELQDWFGGDRSLSVAEQVVGLGNYGKTLTVLTGLDIEEQLEEIEEDEDLVESWQPKFRL